MKEFELTIIMSNYNQERYIKRAIESVFSQKVNFKFRLLIVDDYSCMDNSREVIKNYVAQYDNIEAIFGEENGGYLKNVLRGKAVTRTKYFCLLDADDYWTDQGFLQRAYDFLEEHSEYTIYESNVYVLTDESIEKQELSKTFLSKRYKTGTYSQKMFVNNERVPITQTTGMFFRNTIFKSGIPEVMSNAVGTRAERSFEGDTDRFIMHLKTGLAFYDSSPVGVYRLTADGIWVRLKRSKKMLINARAYMDYYRYYQSDLPFFANKSWYYLCRYFEEKIKDINSFEKEYECIEEDEFLNINEIYNFCFKNRMEIKQRNLGIKQKAKIIIKTIIA